MLIEVVCPVRCESARATPLAQLQRTFEVAEFDAEPRECRERVDDEPTAVAGDVIALVGSGSVWSARSRTDRVGDPLVLPSGVRLASLGARLGVAEGTANERLLHHSASSSASQAAVQPRWKTASCVDESNAVPLGS